MATNKTQIQRLIYVDRAIKEGMKRGKLANCRTIATAYEVSAKSIMRDIDYLKNQCDAPVRYDASRHGFYYTEEQYQLPAINISESDLFAICIARKAMEQHQNTPIYQKLQSVFTRIEESLPDRVSISPAWVDKRISVFSDSQTNIDPLIWDTIAEALHHSHRLQITYQNPGAAKATKRQLDPYHAVSFQGEWYLIGFCHLRQRIRVFAMSRIVKARQLNTVFTIPADFVFETFSNSHFGIFMENQHHKVKIRFSAQLAPYIMERKWHSGQTITKQEDGGLVLSFSTNHLFEIKRWVLSWGCGATVLAPGKLRTDIRRETQKILQAYS